MVRSLKNYIKDKFIESNYKKVILKQDSKIIDMFIEVASDFGFAEKPKTKSYYGYSAYTGGYAYDLYFYKHKLNKQDDKELAFVDYISPKDGYLTGKSVYCDRDGNLFMLDYKDNSIIPTTRDQLDSPDRIKIYDNYMEKISKKDTKTPEKQDENIEYTFIENNGNIKYFYGTDNNFYMSDGNTSKIKINNDTEAYTMCNNILSKIKSMVYKSSLC